MESPSQYQNNEPNTSRSFTEQALDAGSSFDWITPTYEAIRNIAQDGRSFCLAADDWHAIQDRLTALDIPVWGVAMHWLDGDYWFTFSVPAENAETVTALTDYKPNGGRGKAIFMLLVVLGFMAGAVAMVAMVGGAL